MSHRRARGKPVREVELQITVQAEDEILERICRLIKDARVSDGRLSFTVKGRSPALVAKKARKLAQTVRRAVGESK